MPTRAGWSVLGAVVVLGAAGIALDWVDLLVVAAACAAAFVVGFAWVPRRPRLGVDVSLAPARVTVGDAAGATAAVTNRGRLPSLGIDAEVPYGPAVLEVRIPRLGAGETGTVQVGLPTRRRGVVDVGPLALVRRDPFGLFRRDEVLGTAERLWVHPRRYDLAVKSAGRTHDLDAPSADRSPAGTITFHTIREYVEGDDLRFVHWRSTARTGTLMVRQNVDTSRPSTTVILDTSAASYTPASFEVAVEAAASVVDACTAAGFPARVLTTHAEVSGTTRDVAPLTAHLDFLAAVSVSTAPPDPGLLAAAAPGVSGAAVVFVVGALDEAAKTAMAQVRRRYDRATIVDVAAEVGAGAGAFITDATYLAAPSGPAFAAAWNEAGR